VPQDPILKVALPDWLGDALRATQADPPKDDSFPTPVDVTPLIAEFVASLDPVLLVREQAPHFLRSASWRTNGTASVSTSTLRVVRELAQDPKVVSLVALRFPGLAQGQILRARAMPVLLGLAAGSAVGVRVGPVGAGIAQHLAAERDARSERQRSDDASRSAELHLESPSRGASHPPPTLEPLIADLGADSA